MSRPKIDVEATGAITTRATKALDRLMLSEAQADRQMGTDLVQRFGYHPPSDESVGEAHQLARQIIIGAAAELAVLTGVGREQSLMLTKLEEALFWANADIARNQRGLRP